MLVNLSNHSIFATIFVYCVYRRKRFFLCREVYNFGLIIQKHQVDKKINMKVPQNPYLLFLPFLLIYIVLVLGLHDNGMEGDEERYYQFADNLIHGFYSPPSPDINLWNGPGYPILLMPFVALKLPLIFITLLNAVFRYLSIIFLFKALKHYVSHTTALWYSLFWACYYISFQEIPKVLTESFTLFLSSVLIYCLIRAFDETNKKYIYLSGFFIGYLVLTKIVFGYVVLCMLIGYFLLWLFNKKSISIQKSFVIIMVAFVTILPYLFYTYSLTGRIFYLGNSGGMSLYWMSTPYQGEYGDWNNFNFTANCVDPTTPCNAELLKINHQKDFEQILQFKGVEQEDEFKKLAIKNIKEHPLKYFQNCVANISRLFFGIPASYFYQRQSILLRLPPNAIIATLMLFCLIPTIINWKKITYTIRFLLIFMFLYLGSCTLVSAYPRQFYIIVPIVLFWIAYIIQNTLTIDLHFKKKLK
jgi:4-amino-4-deoxy-L-arabinose transferase-like glycosyltransferase